MRLSTTFLAITAGMCLFAAAALGQPPIGQPPTGQPPVGQPPTAQIPPPAPLTPEEKAKLQRLDLVLQYWEQAMTQVEKLEAECERVTEDKVFNTKESYKGTARFMKGAPGPDMTSRASLYLVKSDNKNIYEQFILSGAFFYEIAPAAKQIRAHELPKPKPGANNDHNLVALLFGMKAADAKQRYKIDLAGEDATYYYLQIEPRRAEDKAEFSKAQLALVKTTYMPRQLSLFHPNGNKVTWDMPKVNSNATHLRPADFEAPNPPPGWTIQRVPLNGPAPAPKVRSSLE